METEENARKSIEMFNGGKLYNNIIIANEASLRETRGVRDVIRVDGEDLKADVAEVAVDTKEDKNYLWFNCSRNR